MLFRSILLLTLPAVFLSGTDDTRNVPFLDTDPEAGQVQPPAHEDAAGQPPEIEAGQPHDIEAGQARDLEAAPAQQPAIQRMMNATQHTCHRMGNAMRDPQNQDRAKAACSHASIGCGATTCFTCCCACVPCNCVEGCALIGAAAKTAVAVRNGAPHPNYGRFTKAVLCAVTVTFAGSQAMDWIKGYPKIKFVDEKSNSFGIWHDKDDTTHPSGKMPSAFSWMMGVGDHCAWMPSGMYPGMDGMQTLSVQTPTIISANPTKGGSFRYFLRPATFIREFRTPFEDYGKQKAKMVIGNLESTNRGTALPQAIIGDNGQGDAFWAAKVIEKFPKQAVGFINMVTDKPTIPIEEDKLGVMSNESTPEMGKIYVYMNPGHLAIMARDLKLVNETQFEAFNNHFLNQLKQLPVEKQKDMLNGSCKKFKLDNLSDKMKSHIDYLNAEQKKCLPEEMKSLME